jgi:hypothetical protein
MPTNTTIYSTNVLGDPQGQRIDESKTLEETTPRSIESTEFDYISGNVEQIVSITPMSVNTDGQYQVNPPSGVAQNTRNPSGYFTQPSTTINLTYSVPYDRCVFEAKEYLDDYGWYGFIQDQRFADSTDVYQINYFDQRMVVENTGIPNNKTVDGNLAIRQRVTFSYFRSFESGVDTATLTARWTPEFYNSEANAYGTWNMSTSDLIDMQDVISVGYFGTRIALEGVITSNPEGSISFGQSSSATAYGAGNISFDQQATDITTVIHVDASQLVTDSVDAGAVRCTRWGGSFTKGEYKRS